MLQQFLEEAKASRLYSEQMTERLMAQNEQMMTLVTQNTKLMQQMIDLAGRQVLTFCLFSITCILGSSYYPA
jgi:hypothetical protein